MVKFIYGIVDAAAGSLCSCGADATVHLAFAGDEGRKDYVLCFPHHKAVSDRFWAGRDSGEYVVPAEEFDAVRWFDSSEQLGIVNRVAFPAKRVYLGAAAGA